MCERPNGLRLPMSNRIIHTADILPDNRVVFNIGGNNYRIIVKIEYRFQDVYVRFIGTHAEYDRIDATTV